MILTVTLNPSVDHALFIDGLKAHDTNRVKRTERDAGGKGINVARVFDELGGEVFAIGFLGGGPGAYVRSVLDRQGVKYDFIEVEGETRINFSVEDGSGEPPTTFNEPGPKVSPKAFDALCDRIRDLAPKASWVVLGGSLPPGLERDAFAHLVRLASGLGAKVALDADREPMRLGMGAGPSLIKPNGKEAERLLGAPVTDDASALVAAKKLLGLLDASEDPVVLLSRGEDGAVLASNAGCWFGRSPKVEARSTIGSGDSMVAGYLWALEDGKPIEEALRWALAAGAATATTDGSEIARRPVIEKLLTMTTVEPA